MSGPATPLHAKPNEQIDLDNVRKLDKHDIDDLDLNPELEGSASISNFEDDSLGHENKARSKRRMFDPADNDTQMYDEIDDFQPRVSVDSPFSSGTVLNKLSKSSDAPVNSGRRLSLSQQSKFILYCDDRLMEIQRKYVQSRGLNTQSGYSGLSPLLQDLKSLVDFIWYSIEGVPNTDYLLRGDSSVAEESESQAIDNSTYFGQSAYLIRIADDLLDYVDKFDVRSLPTEQQTSTLSKLFKLLLILDRVFARLLTGRTPGGSKMTGTDAVRLTGIAERTRTKMPRFLEHNDIHGYHYEVSKIYEETLESCGN
ncbi:hypothetical protein HG536_0F04300 [Torulaspora globosa]|uniref:Uncharacterized protein n=1 Tax=Torulaspora globosa TaxID=48254 RepID=A0A7G3ZKR8_9SACH|nr:uncharacterized protein HG536_0F04300 [Torulaspora globosa]QLL34104.1 hypothetical protein HG536_0F04300 [Torulaspora globosa]